MAKREELFDLIHSLTQSEKRYFKLSCKKEIGEHNYLQLFNVIEGQTLYNEKQIKEQFKQEKFAKQLHVTKNYLRKIILKSLRNFHTNISKDAALKDILRNLEILFNKELYEQCQTELKKAKNIAEKYELTNGTVEVINWKRKLEQVANPSNYGVFKTFLEQQQHAITALDNVNSYWHLAVDVSVNLFKNSTKNIKNITLLSNPDSAITLEAKVLYYNTKYLLELEKGESDKAEKQLLTLIKYLENHSERIYEEPGLYVSSINNLVSYLTFGKKYQKALSLIQKAKGIYDTWEITSEKRTLLKQIMRTYNIELEIYRDSKLFKQKNDIVENIELFVNKNVYKMPKEYLLSFRFQLASIHFMRKDFSRSLQWTNQLLNGRSKEIRIDLQIQAHMLNLMIHLEQQNLMVLRYFVDSTRRYLKKVKEVQPFEEILLKFFSKIGRLPLMEYKAAFTMLYENLFPENGDQIIPKELAGFIDYQDWIAWNLKRRN